MKIISSLAIYSRRLDGGIISGITTVTNITLQRLGWINIYGTVAYRFLAILAFLMLFLVSIKMKDKRIIAIILYLLLISSIFGTSTFFVYHLTLSIIMFCLFIHYRDNYNKKKTNSAHLVMSSFFIIFLSQLILVFMVFSRQVYIVGEVIQLIGYLMLLYAFVMVIKK